MKNEISVMVVDDCESYARRLDKSVSLREGLTSVGYALNGREGLEMAAMMQPDAIVLDMLMPELDGMAFLRRLGSIGLQQKPIVIVNSFSKLTSMVETAERAGADYFMVKPQPDDTVCDTIIDLAGGTKKKVAEREEEYSLETSVSYFLRALGVPANLDGYKYMRSAIIYASMDMSLLDPITKKLYPMIADKYSTSGGCVERSMRHAISVSWQRGNKKMMNDIFGYTIDDRRRRPTNSEYIAMAADDFRIRCKYGMLNAH